MVIPDGSDKDLHSIATGISFINSSIHNADDELIDFIKVHTGKMKPLASADLDFYLTTGTQLLNIGKPFYLDGIGTLIMNKQGRLDFTPGEYSTLKLEDPENDRKEKAEKRRSLTESSHRAQAPQGNKGRQVLLLIAIIGGIVIIGWGGYTLYKKNTVPEPVDIAVPLKSEPAAAPPPKTDSQSVAANQPVSTQARKPDSITTTLAVPANSNLYKFIILRTANKFRALKRYNQLLSFDLNIKMDTKDSSFFKLYFPIAAATRDTMHIKDSLATYYGSRVSIER